MMNKLSAKISVLILYMAFVSGFARAQVTYSGVKPGEASIRATPSRLVVQNKV
jgi:hypothetical protein